MQTARLVALAIGLVPTFFLKAADAQSFSVPVSIQADVAGGASKSNLAINMTGKGSGTNAPANAQYGLNMSCAKDNWKTTTNVGEIDCLNIGLHQGGPGSDGSGILVGVMNTGMGNISDLNMTASQLNTTTNAIAYSVNVQVGLITSGKQAYGEVIDAVSGTGGTAVLVNSETASSWQNVIEGSAQGGMFFWVDGSGNIHTYGNIQSASLVTSGSLHALSNPVEAISDSHIVQRSDCGTTIRSSDRTPSTFTVPRGLPVGCHINVIQASDGIITFKGRDITGEHTGAPDPRKFQTQGPYAEAELLIDSPKTFLLRGDVGVSDPGALNLVSNVRSLRQDVKLTSYQ